MKKDLDPWVTSPLFDDECNAMDPLDAMVAGRPPFADVGSDESGGSSCGGGGGGLKDCPSPVRVISDEGLLLDRLCESWEGDGQSAAGNGTGDDDASGGASGRSAALTAAAAGRFTVCDDVAPGGGHDLLPSSKQDQGVSSYCLDASVPDASGRKQVVAELTATEEGSLAIHTNVLENSSLQEAEDDVPVGAAGSSRSPASSSSRTPPPPPRKPVSVTAAFLKDSMTASAEPPQQDLARWDDPSKIGASGPGGAMLAGSDSASAVALEPVSSQDLLLNWLRREASAGDEEAQFHLAQLFSPPRFEMKTECRECGEPFGVTRYRHHCRHCGGSFCHEHAWHEHPIPKLGLPAPQARVLFSSFLPGKIDASR